MLRSVAASNLGRDQNDAFIVFEDGCSLLVKSIVTGANLLETTA